MATADTVAEQRVEVAKVASTIFGTEITPENVITETLVRATSAADQDSGDLATAVERRGGVEELDPMLLSDYNTLADDPLASWIESEFGLNVEPGTNILVRGAPQTVEGAAAVLARKTGKDATLCRNAIRATLLAGSRVRHPESQRPRAVFRREVQTRITYRCLPQC